MEYLMHIVGNESKWCLWTIKEDITPASNRSSSYSTQVATIYYILVPGLNNSILSVSEISICLFWIFDKLPKHSAFPTNVLSYTAYKMLSTGVFQCSTSQE